MRTPRLALGFPDRTLYFSLLVVSLLAAKLLHVFSHLRTTAIFLFLLYFPTFFTPDLFVICISRILFRQTRIFGAALCLVITFAAAAQIGLFLETGGELRWSMMARILQEPRGFVGMLMSGFFGTSVVVCALLGVAWLLNPLLWNLTMRCVRAFFTTIWPRRFSHLLRSCPSAAQYEACPDEDEEQQLVDEKTVNVSTSRRIWWSRLKLATFAVTMVILHVVRPKAPFTHMTTTLPFTLFEGIFFRLSPLCDPSPWDANDFPLADLTQERFWSQPVKAVGGNGRGWRPGTPWWEVKRERPYWLPHEEVSGFAKWYRGTPQPPPGPPPPPPPGSHTPPKNHHLPPPPPPPSPPFGGKHPFPAPPGPRAPPAGPGYENVLDPLKVANFDQPLLASLEDALKEAKSKVPIKHVVIMTLESTRKDVFPMVKDDALYRDIEESRANGAEKRDEEVWADLADFSPNAETITGQDAHFGRSVNATHGGLNIEGAQTASSFTLKSLLASYCGVGPLSVDFLEELETEIYQPCLPQILKAMNAQKALPSTKDGSWPWANATWKSTFMQASTDKFDRQREFVQMLGFDETMYRENLVLPDAKYPVQGPELNYFGYSERELKPYIRDLFADAEKNNERVFLSHLTSSTHHPWATPEEFGPQKKYWGGVNGDGSPWDRYLNSIKFADEWVGEVLELLEETGVANKTLVVVLGDHGFSFGDSTTMMKTTYANAHIKSFRIPMAFYHPSLPRVQLNLTVTPLSVLPTILDLLASSDSLSTPQTDVARDLIPEYEGQSLIRGFRTSQDGRRAWNFGVVNPGGTQLSVMSTGDPFRLVLPICEADAFSFTNLAVDRFEDRPVKDWEGGASLAKQVNGTFGADAASWVEEAEAVGRWYVWENRRRWGYWAGTRREDRGPAHWADGHLEHDHWWDT
ncbi:MAG: hypothetical protein M1825_002648 [Sarcosagium campestre]|nr:MAG: hypothetical protein M1825_002648 [Sarcosagium campestre]